jgi:amino acid transporter
MALGACFTLGGLALVTLIFFKTFGVSFLTAVYGGALPPELGSSGAYFFLTSAQLDNTIFAALLSATWVLALPVIVATIILIMSRVVFAWAFDGILPEGVTKVTQRNAPIAAVWLLVLASVAVLAWAIFVASSFLQVVVYGTLLQIAAMALVGVAAIAVPYRRPELFRASTSNARLLGIPVVSIAGAVAVAAAAIVWYLFLHFPYFGVADKGTFFIWAAGTVVFGLLFYAVARAIRARQGIDLRLVYTEIPPE